MTKYLALLVLVVLTSACPPPPPPPPPDPPTPTAAPKPTMNWSCAGTVKMVTRNGKLTTTLVCGGYCGNGEACELQTSPMSAQGETREWCGCPNLRVAGAAMVNGLPVATEPSDVCKTVVTRGGAQPYVCSGGCPIDGMTCKPKESAPQSSEDPQGNVIVSLTAECICQ